MDNGVEALFGFVGTHGDALEFLEYRPCATASQSATATFARLIRRAALSETYRRTATSPRLIPCARHRDPAAPRPRRGKSSFSPRTWSGWIPVTSTGMRKSNKPPRVARISTGLRALPGKVCNGFPPGIASDQTLRAFQCFHETR